MRKKTVFEVSTEMRSAMVKARKWETYYRGKLHEHFNLDGSIVTRLKSSLSHQGILNIQEYVQTKMKAFEMDVSRMLEK